MPLVKRSHGDDFGPGLQRRFQRRLVILAVDAVPCVVTVPGPDGGVDIAWTDTGDENQIVAIAESLNGSPVLLGRAVGKAISCKVRVNAVKAGIQDFGFMFLVHEQADKDAIVRGVSDASLPGALKQPSPDSWTLQIGVVNIEQRKKLSSA